MNALFIVATGTSVSVLSRRTNSIAKAFMIARHFPSAIMVWDADKHTPVATGNFNNPEELNSFFDEVRKEL